MLIRIIQGIDGVRAAQGVVVVIDVMRAFTTAAYAFDAGLADIELVSTAEEAFASDGFRMGEIGGRLIPGFDHNNSPSRLIGRKLAGRGILRTGSGTQCVVAAKQAGEIWLGSLVVASATARAIKDRDAVTLVASGAPNEGEEDLACAEWLASLLDGRPCRKDDVIAVVRGSRAAAKHRPRESDWPLEDLDCATSFDAFDFAMKVERQAGRTIAKRVIPP
ncbi:MAG TPA: 2-phosphosulfolactate phosphatase [Candidatus Polarisedimenticolia bacterium]|nr:2-phosphosulfolactate phosphatase [Candidatus Polarisedimenticolia bacterium]